MLKLDKESYGFFAKRKHILDGYSSENNDRRNVNISLNNNGAE